MSASRSSRSIVLLCLPLYIFLAIVPVWAAEVEPGFVRKSVRVGKLESFGITLRTGQVQEKVSIQPVNFAIDHLGQISIAKDDVENPFSAKQWCQLKPTEVILRKGADKQLKIPVRIPPGTPGGEYFMALQVHNPLTTAQRDQGLNVNIEMSFLVLVVLDVKGGRRTVAGKVLEPKISVKDAFPTINATFENSGTVSVISRMAAVIRNEDRQVMDKFVVFASASQQQDGQAFVMPRGQRDYSGEGNRKLPPGRYSAEMVSQFGVQGSKEKRRTKTSFEFEVEESEAHNVSPIDDVVIKPDPLILEMPSGGTQFMTVGFKNRGLKTVEAELRSENPTISFFPKKVKILPGKTMNVRFGVKLPATEDPRRDIPIQIKDVTQGAEGKVRDLKLSIYAPGTAPAPEENRKEVKSEDSNKEDKNEGPSDTPKEEKPADVDRKGSGGK